MYPEIEEIKLRRKKIGVSQKKLAKLVGVSQSLIAKLECGKFDPKLSLVKKIQEVLNGLEGKKCASAIMKSPVICASPEDVVRDVVKVMLEHGISQMPVIQEGKIVGSITENKIIKKIFEGKIDFKVKDVMEQPFPCVGEKTPLNTIIKLLLEFPAVLVKKDSEIVGIITKHDVMKVLTEEER
ncbi:MAG: CBS domain-containing protein [Archaeoglobaceae archaeon]|nr:CBS domain-containing protein [Archaeoglobaceae archaeon]MCX8152160.1 CBS domain-containing protein [Archaeoglobaceae archaeon]MDW8013876.1 CBS domain-containing protein [Archaeoglobaceae archaeon]